MMATYYWQTGNGVFKKCCCYGYLVRWNYKMELQTPASQSETSISRGHDVYSRDHKFLCNLLICKMHLTAKRV